MKTLRLTTTQALVQFLKSQYLSVNGKEERLFYGGFGIFGHGNVTCLAESLYDAREELPTYRGQNEQSMALAALGFTKAKNRKQIMFVSSSIGPGATNMITACGVAYTNSLPLLVLAGDYFHNRFSTPVLQQIEQNYDSTASANDCFKPIVKYWDRITIPEQLLHSLPLALETLLNPATCGPVFLGLCQDTQAQAFDFPLTFLEKRVHHIPRQRADREKLQQAARLIIQNKKIVILAGAGVIYSEAQEELLQFSQSLQIPFVTTASAKSLCKHNEKYNIGPVGILGSQSANDLLKESDCVVVIGSRLQDFTTASWTNFNQNTKLITINTCSLDAIKHQSLALCSDAKEALKELLPLCKNYKADTNFLDLAFEKKRNYDVYISQRCESKGELLSYANVIGCLNTLVNEKDKIVLAAGGLPGEFNTLWKNLAFGSIDHEYGFSCMGYEISGGYGCAIAHKEGDTIVLCGDGSYMMLNSELYSSVLTGDKMIILVCDNEGYAVINRLQVHQGGEPFNNLIKDCKRTREAFMIDFVAHAKSLGANGGFASTLEEFQALFKEARESKESFVIHIKVSAYDWTEYSNTWWEVGVPEVSHKESIIQARKNYEMQSLKQRKGI
ncbi:3D-(3,5/4)-trihydroxycyclohexane-1,2-dione acylhydrolase (decyclizing) [Campylobacter sp. MIT 21-1685]|uniref:3D-(3,5/4)-trihydroxycyclohexane-1,2-dione acylhydrolase (decyclizing) n=1 Tax=unclassified Campylobacter TaxID=2593542 RepID=UPI00224B452C|nr:MULTISPECIES: 3D-(3,5/4)-trihydroxycyclohexane-1,2-dione acylhydrolase (decyclizing) [unclassified Campylobacter]MCX2682508.1 3D-(3,5/4)-trihydroxycyclohexane-1,2-dione acylhydrolase (decyclizing) [Campylobacter sp. MIT 21-1684]MCX2750779.1 3D-(3,5/4)-trihydroxycyclohexane-1,2-dione acylhydrolase (decyclizing) [Campylobacter sp. MIT 21-1682]MCX2806989.1 3D-(3,5/4)-trihydroxycyclohexane-1,2-dione acylhydrolase (decyclizing) [Campylobacter sp. MIT 21-1685]